VGNRSEAVGPRVPVPNAWWLCLLIGLAILPGLLLADQRLTAIVQGWRSPPVLMLMEGVTRLGEGAVDIGIFLLVALSGWGRGERRLAIRGLAGAATVAGAGLLGQVLKNVACRGRPNGPEPGVFFTNFPCLPAPYAEASFPSGHAITAFAAAVLLAYWYPRQGGVFLGLAGLVGLSRILLGVHFPSDVLAGALLGSAVALVAHASVAAVRRTHAVPDASPE